MRWNDAADEYYNKTRKSGGSLASLPAEWQRELVALSFLDQAVMYGGYLSFLANHGRSVYDYASRALKAIGARRAAEIVDGCQALVDEHYDTDGRSQQELALLLPGPILSRDGETIKEAGSVLPEAALARVYELSYEYMNYADSVGELAERHYGPLINKDVKDKQSGYSLVKKMTMLRLVLALILTVLIGLASRLHPIGWFLYDRVLGEVLYAVAAYLVLAMIFFRKPPWFVAIVAFVCCLAVEVFKLTGIPADNQRIFLVRWFLGMVFDWINLGYYFIGVVLIAFADWATSNAKRTAIGTT